MNTLSFVAVLAPALALTLLSYFINLHDLMPTMLASFIIAIIASATTFALGRRKPAPRKNTANVVKSAPGTAKEVGSVKWFNASKGFGFITRANGEEIFVHFRSINGQRTLRDGQRVEFAVTNGSRGPQAEDVVAVK